MPINPRGNSWQASVSYKGRRFRRDFPTKIEAERWEADAKAALLRGELPDMGGSKASPTLMTIGELYRYTCKNRWANKSKSLTINGQAVVDTIGATTLVSKIDMQCIDRCIHLWYEEGNTSATVNRKLAALSTMLTEAVRLNIIQNKPYIRRQKESEHRLRFFSHDEEKAITDFYRHIGRFDMAELCEVAVDTGLRQGVLLKLEPSDFEFAPDGETSWVRIPGPKMKNRKAHSVPLTARARDICKRRAQSGGYIFPLTKDQVAHYWKVMREALGMQHDKQFVFHVFRHTFCSRLVQAGVPIEVVQKLAGHETLQMTMRYAKLAPRNLTSAISVLERKEPQRELAY